MDFTESQIQRYSRHILLQEVGAEGQEKLCKGSVLLIGAGGLGSPAALYLAAAGIGRIGIVDDDVVDLTNLQRQILHFTHDIGEEKVLSAKNKLEQLNPDSKVEMYNYRITPENIVSLIKEYDFVIDGTDNFATKFLINDACVMQGKAFSHGGILRFEGQTLTFTPGKGCYRCVFEEPPPPHAVPTCSQAGVLGSIAGILGTIQATEALKYLLGKGNLLTNRLLVFNALEMQFREVAFERNPECPVCGDNPRITSLSWDDSAECG